MAWPETVRKSDLEITWFSGTGAGGQYRNRHPNCCRMVHKPTGTRTTGQSHRERIANQREAFRALCRILVPLMKAAARRTPESRSDERIRTYHIPDRRVTDHRVKGRRFNPDRVLDGELEPIHRAVKEAIATTPTANPTPKPGSGTGSQD